MKTIMPDVGRQQASTSKVRASSDSLSGWVHVERSSLDARYTHRKPDGEPITVRERLMWAILEGYCYYGKRFCRPGTKELSEAYGCSVRTLFQILKEMDEDGIIRRVSEGPMDRRIGIILLKRTNPDRPETEESEIPDLIARLKAEIGGSSGGHPPHPQHTEPARKTAQSLRGKPREDCAENRAIELALSFEAEEPESDADEGESSQRQRQEIPEPASQLPPTPPPKVPPVPVPAPVPPPSDPRSAAAAGLPAGPPRPVAANGAALVAALAGLIGPDRAAPPDDRPVASPPPPPRPAAPSPAEGLAAVPNAEELTPGQVAFLDSLSPDQVAELGQLPAEKRADMLVPHRLGLDRIIAAEQSKRLGPKAPPPPPPALPATTGELLMQLPGAPPQLVQAAVQMIILDFGNTPQDHRLRRAFENLCQDVRDGREDAEKVADAYRQAMNPGVKVRGAVFNRALQNHGICCEGASRT